VKPLVARAVFWLAATLLAAAVALLLSSGGPYNQPGPKESVGRTAF
jgi:hypothetical protein